MPAQGVTPRLLELVYNALLRSFWRKRALRAFLRSSGVKEAYLATWAEDESKRDFLDRLLPEMERAKGGGGAINAMARALSEQTSFPDLRGWEESARMEQEARQAVAELVEYLRAKDDERRTTREREESRARMRERQNVALQSASTLQQLSDRLTGLHGSLGTAAAGYDFQDWFYDLMSFSEIKNRRPYVHDGRQIDGSVTILETTYLVELKFTAEQADATDIDTFYKKVGSKADNTMGILISISGYSSVAIREASGPRTPLLLLDHAHIFAVLTGTIRFVSLIDRVRRHASQTGEAYLPISRFSGA